MNERTREEYLNKIANAKKYLMDNCCVHPVEVTDEKGITKTVCYNPYDITWSMNIWQNFSNNQLRVRTDLCTDGIEKVDQIIKEVQKEFPSNVQPKDIEEFCNFAELSEDEQDICILYEGLKRDKEEQCTLALGNSVNSWEVINSRTLKLSDPIAGKNLREIENRCINFPLISETPYYDENGVHQFTIRTTTTSEKKGRPSEYSFHYPDGKQFGEKVWCVNKQLDLEKVLEFKKNPDMPVEEGMLDRYLKSPTRSTEDHLKEMEIYPRTTAHYEHAADIVTYIGTNFSPRIMQSTSGNLLQKLYASLKKGGFGNILQHNAKQKIDMMIEAGKIEHKRLSLRGEFEFDITKFGGFDKWMHKYQIPYSFEVLTYLAEKSVNSLPFLLDKYKKWDTLKPEEYEELLHTVPLEDIPRADRINIFRGNPYLAEEYNFNMEQTLFADGAEVGKLEIRDYDFNSLTIENIYHMETVFYNCNFSNATIKDSTLRNVTFNNCSLNSAIVRNITGSIMFVHCDLQYANFREIDEVFISNRSDIRGAHIEVVPKSDIGDSSILDENTMMPYQKWMLNTTFPTAPLGQNARTPQIELVDKEIIRNQLREARTFDDYKMLLGQLERLNWSPIDRTEIDTYLKSIKDDLNELALLAQRNPILFEYYEEAGKANSDYQFWNYPHSFATLFNIELDYINDTSLRGSFIRAKINTIQNKKHRTNYKGAIEVDTVYPMFFSKPIAKYKQKDNMLEIGVEDTEGIFWRWFGLENPKEWFALDKDHLDQISCFENGEWDIDCIMEEFMDTLGDTVKNLYWSRERNELEKKSY